MLPDLNFVETQIDALLPYSGEMESLFDQLWPICRSLAGPGFRESFDILSTMIPLEHMSFPTGAQVLDWTIPPEWEITDAYIEYDGKRVVDFTKNNLHVVSYSTPVDMILTLDELQPHLHSRPDLPSAIPYITSYYNRTWGFCLSHKERMQLKPGLYRAVIKSKLVPGFLTTGVITLRATEQSLQSLTRKKNEVLISTYLCHPSMANNELSGPIVAAFLYRALARLPVRTNTYTFVVCPETIGSIAVLSKIGQRLIDRCRAGLVLTCCGDGRALTFKHTRHGDTEIDRIMRNLFFYTCKNTTETLFEPSGSDERQYNSPGFGLPVGALMHSVPGTFPEYHTSLDNKSILSFPAMRETVRVCLRACLALEHNRRWVATVTEGEPQLGRRGLYPSLGGPVPSESIMRMMWLLNMSDGNHDLCDIAARAGCSMLELVPLVEQLVAHGLLDEDFQ